MDFRLTLNFRLGSREHAARAIAILYSRRRILFFGAGQVPYYVRPNCELYIRNTVSNNWKLTSARRLRGHGWRRRRTSQSDCIRPDTDDIYRLYVLALTPIVATHYFGADTHPDFSLIV